MNYIPVTGISFVAFQKTVVGPALLGWKLGSTTHHIDPRYPKVSQGCPAPTVHEQTKTVHERRSGSMASLLWTLVLLMLLFYSFGAPWQGKGDADRDPPTSRVIATTSMVEMFTCAWVNIISSMGRWTSKRRQSFKCARAEASWPQPCFRPMVSAFICDGPAVLVWAPRH